MMAPERALTATGRRFAIATPHRDATRAGVEAIGAGGNAIDAALAAAVTLAAVYPHMCGVGGDLFALVRQPDGTVFAVNSSGAAPVAIDVDGIRRDHGTMPIHGPLPVTVPGAAAGWHELWRLGAVRPFAAAFEPGIAAARDGVAVARSLAASIASEPERTLADAGLRGIFAPGGEPLRAGAALFQPSLARTLAAIAEGGPEALYDGEVGSSLVRALNDRGSPMSRDDLRSHVPEVVPPLVRRYRDLDVAVVPPNSQGFALLQILRAIERLGLDPDPLGPDAAPLAEVFHAVALDRDRTNADPRSARIDVDTLLDDRRLDEVLTAVRRETHPAKVRPSGDTIALVAADGDGRAVSLIQSLSDSFGSGILEPSTGVVLHNRGSAFSLDPSSPNVLGGGKRPAHTLMPVLVHRRGDLAAVSGSMGGGGQPQINGQTLTRVFDLGMRPADAVGSPRWLAGGMDLGAGRWIDAESRVPDRVRKALRAADFVVNALQAVDERVGHAHLIVRRDDGMFDVGSDPRADGEAAAG
jgi:gamma-glutamyltranspeptidase